MSNVESLIAEQIDIWTSAVKTKSSAGRGSTRKRELYGIKKLRELILELAVRGLLVPQDSNDEPAHTLLQQIASEKAQLIKDKKIKKQKPLPEISDDEKQFELPYSWEWTRLGDLAEDIHYGYTASARHEGEGVRLLRITDIQDHKVNWLSVPFCDIDNKKAQQYLLKDSDILIARTGGTIGKSYLVSNINVPAVFASYLIRIKKMTPVYSPFIKLYLGSQLYWTQLYKNAAGTGQPNVNATALKGLIISIPPLEEQYRITSKVEELMALCDKLEHQTDANIDAHEVLVSTLLKALTDVAASSENGAEQFQLAWERIAENFDILFTTENSVEELKQAILQLAVMGKLVPQDPNNEPASIFLEKIAAEKEQFIKNKKIKKQKPLPEISDDEKPFEQPHGWEFERIGTFGIVGTGATPSRSNSNYWNPAVINWVSSGETSELFVGTTKEKVSELAIKETNVSVYPIGTLIVAMYGQGKTRGQITELTEEAGTNQACAAIQLVDKSPHHKDYVKLYFRKSYAELRSLAAGGAQPNLNVGKVANTILAIPPLEEQKKIVAKTEQLLCICDELVEKINIANKKQLKLADAIVNKSIS